MNAGHTKGLGEQDFVNSCQSSGTRRRVEEKDSDERRQNHGDFRECANEET